MVLKRAKQMLCTAIAMLVGVSAANFRPMEIDAAFEQTAAEVVAEMGFGWNLGNLLDACPQTGTLRVGSISSETSWGNPKASQTLIDGVKASGVDSVRVPVTWYNHMDPTTYKIDDAWMSCISAVLFYI